MRSAALVLASGFNALSIVEDLGEVGIEVFCLDDARGIATFSKYAKFVQFPDPNNDFESAKKLVINFVAKMKNYDRIFVIPTSDGHSVLLSHIKNQFPSNVMCCVGSFSTTQSLIDKNLFGDIAETHGLPTPMQIPIDNLPTLSEVDLPVVIKPIEKKYEHLVSTVSRSNARITVLNDIEQLNRFYEKIYRIKDKVVCQQYINGHSDQMYTVGVYSNKDNNHTHLFFGRKKRGYPAEYGDCIFGETIDEIPDLKKITKKIVEDLKLFGIYEFEYKFDSIREKFFLIEINPRSWSWIGITKFSSGSLVLKFVEDHSNKILGHDDVTQLKNVAYVKLFQDVFNTFFRYKRVRPDWSRNPVSYWREIKSYDKVVIAEFRTRDIRIPLGLAYLAVRRLINALRKH